MSHNIVIPAQAGIQPRPGEFLITTAIPASNRPVCHGWRNRYRHRPLDSGQHHAGMTVGEADPSGST